MPRLFARVFAAGCLSLAPASLASAPDNALVRYMFKAPQPLTLDPSRIALRLARSADGEAALRDAGVVPSLDPLAVEGWWIAELPDRPPADTLPALIGRLAADARVLFVSPVLLGDDGGPVIIPPEILVAFDRRLDARAADAALARLDPGVVIEPNFGDMPGTYRIRALATSGLDVLRAANDLARRPEVLFAEPDWLFTGHGGLIPNDKGFDKCWGLHNTGQEGGTPDMDMDAPEAWDTTTGDPDTTVVVIDVGVQLDHPDLYSIIGADFTGEGGGGGPVNDCDNHGTPVAGCINATINNTLGTVGVAPTCRVGSARAFISTDHCDGSWTAQASWTVNALAWAVSISADVTNNSNGYGFQSAAIEQKYADTRALGIVHFASAGNNGKAQVGYPARLPSVNAVAALTRSGDRADFSNYGTGLDLSAPGEDIYTTDRTGPGGWFGGNYVPVSGTSFASPYAAGVAALVKSLAPGLSTDQVEQILATTCVDRGPPGYDTGYGWGFVNAKAAVDAAAPPPCSADCDLSGELDLFDFLCYTNQFNAQDPGADCVPDGALDFFDFLCFQNAFNQGC